MTVALQYRDVPAVGYTCSPSVVVLSVAVVGYYLRVTVVKTFAYKASRVVAELSIDSM